MKSLRRFLTRLGNFATRRQSDERLQEEIEEHIALETEENIRAGLSPAEARRHLFCQSQQRPVTAVAVMTLAIAIGANALVFGVMNALILRPLNVPEPESLYEIERPASGTAFESYPDYLDLRDRTRARRHTAHTRAGE